MFESKIKIGWIVFGKEELKYYVGACLLIGLIMWTYGYISLLNSDAYQFSQQYIRSNKTVIENLGNVESTRLGFSNFRRHYSGGIWNVKFNVDVDGQKGSATVFLNLISSDAGWIVEQGTLDYHGLQNIRN